MLLGAYILLKDNNNNPKSCPQSMYLQHNYNMMNISPTISHTPNKCNKQYGSYRGGGQPHMQFGQSLDVYNPPNNNTYQTKYKATEERMEDIDDTPN